VHKIIINSCLYSQCWHSCPPTRRFTVHSQCQTLVLIWFLRWFFTARKYLLWKKYLLKIVSFKKNCVLKKESLKKSRPYLLNKNIGKYREKYKKSDDYSIFARVWRSSRSRNIESSPLSDNLFLKKHFFKGTFFKNKLFLKRYLFKRYFFLKHFY